MARPERNNVDYFPHPVGHGKKMSYMRKRYGNNGYAAWFILLEKLGNANFHYLDLQDEIEVMFLSDEISVDEETLISIVNDLVRLKEFDKEFWEKERILFNQTFVNSIEDAYSKRNSDCITRNSLISHLIGLDRIKPNSFQIKGVNNEVKVPDNPQSKVEESIEEETKQKTDSEGLVIDSIPPDDGKPKLLKLPSSDLPEIPDQKQEDELAKKATDSISAFFNISEQLNAKSYFEISRFVQHFSNTGNIEILRTQFKAYRELKELDGCKHSWKNFIGDARDKYQSGKWCEKTWTKELLEYKSKQSKFSGNGAKELPIVLSKPRTNRNPI